MVEDMYSIDPEAVKFVSEVINHEGVQNAGEEG
jgi:hypothetical protein